MNIIDVYSSTFERFGVIDVPYSLVLVERYDESGEIEVHVPVTLPVLPYLIPGQFLFVPDESDMVLIIEDVNPEYTDTEGEKLIIKGHCAKSILKSRVIQEPKLFSGNAQDIVLGLLDDHFISPENPNRTVDLLEYTVSTDPNVTSVIYENHFEVATVYDIILDICKKNSLGMKIVLTSNKKLSFSLYSGTDRSHEQTENPRVVFSRDFDNVITSSYYLSTVDYKNLIRVKTTDVDPSLMLVDVYSGTEPSGLNRKEGYLEMSAPTVPDGDPPLTNQEVEEVIHQKGASSLYELRPRGIFDGDFDINGIFKYGEDFFLGDLVQCNIAEKKTKTRIVERVFTIGQDGVSDQVAFDFDL